MNRPSPALSAHVAVLNPDRHTAPFWEAAREHRLVAQRCATCNTHRMPPGPICFACQSAEYVWDTLPGTGTVYTFTITHHAFAPYFREATPYAIAIIELDGAPGARLVTAVVDTELTLVEVGATTQIVWDDVDSETSVPRAKVLT